MVKLANMPQIRKMSYIIKLLNTLHIYVYTLPIQIIRNLRNVSRIILWRSLCLYTLYKTVKTLIGQIAHLINFDPNSELALAICIYQIYRNVCRCLYSNKHEPLFIISFSNNFTYSSRTLSEKKYFYI